MNIHIVYYPYHPFKISFCDKLRKDLLLKVENCIMSIRWYWYPAPKGLTLEKMFDQKAKFCFLVGAGVSLDPPSCLPTGYHFTKAILEYLIPEAEQEAIITLTDPEREGMQGPGDFLRFYQLMEYLHNWYDPDLKVLDALLRTTTPNFNHFFLAEMLRQDHKVVTTNFDSLIEYALLEKNVPRTQIIPVIHQQDWKASANLNQYQVYKIHGSMIDIRDNKDCRESLQATVTQMMQEKTEVFQLEEWKLKPIQFLLQNYDVIALGFSGLDDFDVIPTLQTISSSKRIFWVTHTNKPLKNLQIEIVHKDDSEQSSQVSASDRVGRNLLSFRKYNTRQPNQIIRITVHTGQLLAWLWKRYLKQDPLKIDTTPCPETHLTLSWLPNLSEAEKWKLAGKIYEDRHLPTQSLKTYQTALSFAKQEKNKTIQSTCLNNIGSVHMHQGNLEEALKHFQQALEISEELKDLPGIAIRLTNIGWIYRNQGHLEEALKYIRQALTIDEQLGNEYGKSFRLTNIGAILMSQEQLDTALEHFKQALSISDELGHLQGKASNLNNIGTVLFKQDQLDESLKYYQQAFNIFDQVGDLIKKSTSLNNIGTVLQRKGQIEGALDHYQQALTLSEQVSDLRGKAFQLNNIATLYSSQGRGEESLEYYQKALTTNEQIGDLRGKIINLDNIGSLHEGQGRVEEALECYQQVLDINTQLNDTNGKLIQLKNLSRFLENQGRILEAIDYFKQSLDLYDQIGDLKSKAFRANNIGTMYKSLQQINEALEYFQQSVNILEQLGDLESKAKVLNNIAILYYEQGQFEEALKYFNQIITVADKLGDLKIKADILDRKGMLLFSNLKRADEALEQHKIALHLYDQLNHPQGKATQLNNVGFLLQDKGHLDEALEYYHQALVLDEQINDLRGKATRLTNIGLVFEDKNQYDKALEIYRQGLAIEEQQGNFKGQSILLKSIGRTLRKKGDLKEALVNYEKTLQIVEQLNAFGLIISLNKVINELKEEIGS